MIVSDDDAARRCLADAFLAAGWLNDQHHATTVTHAIAHLEEVARGASIPDCLLIDCQARSDDALHAIAAIRRCDGAESLPIVVMTSAPQGVASPQRPYTLGVLWIHLLSYEPAALATTARALRRILAGRGDLFRRANWIRDDDLSRLALLVGSER